jgi:hydrogenase maturation protease
VGAPRHQAGGRTADPVSVPMGVSSASSRPRTAGERPPFEPEPAPVTVLGVGNSIMADDGVGLELLAALASRPRDGVNYVDGAVGGMELVPVVQDSTRLLILDAVAGSVPGTVVRLRGDQVPRMLATKLSPHQVGLLDVLAASRLLGNEPAEVAVVGVVPELVDLRLGLSASVSAAVPEAAAAAEAIIDAWLGETAAEAS